MDFLDYRDAVSHTHLRQPPDAVLCCALTEFTASPLREFTKRAHKWTKASAVTPFAGHSLAYPALLGASGDCSFLWLTVDIVLQLCYR